MIQRSDPRYTEIARGLAQKDYELVNGYVDPTVALNLKKLTIKDSLFFWDGRQLPDNFYRIFLALVSKKRSLIPYLHFVLDRLDSSSERLSHYIDLISSNAEAILPYDFSCRFFVTRSGWISDRYPEFIKFVADDSFGDIKEPTYLEYLEGKFGTNMLSIFKKDKNPQVKMMAQLHSVINYFEYTKEDVQWACEKLIPLLPLCDLPSLTLYFKTFERFKNWINHSTHRDIIESSDYLRIDSITDFSEGLFKRSNNFGDFSRLLRELSINLNFKSEIIDFSLPIGLKKFDYTFYAKGTRYDVQFARSNFDLYSWGLEFDNCAAGYTQRVVRGDNLIFVVAINGKKKIIGDLEAVKRDGFSCKIKDKTKIKKIFDHWRVQQFKNTHNSETMDYKNESIKMLKQIGLDIVYRLER